jgi:hypothetical protein
MHIFFRVYNLRRSGTPPNLTQFGRTAPVTSTNGTYFSATPFAIWRFISARGFVSQS